MQIKVSFVKISEWFKLKKNVTKYISKSNCNILYYIKIRKTWLKTLVMENDS